MSLVYKLMTADEWSVARRLDDWDGSAVDKQDGFIHLSAPDQVRATLDKWFAGRGDLYLVGFDIGQLSHRCDVRWEASRGGALFPHVYGPLPISLLQSVHKLTPDRYELPPL